MIDRHIDTPPMLWVVDEFGSLLGLLKADFPPDVLHRGVVFLVADVQDGIYERVSFDVKIWHDPKSRAFWYVLQSRTNSIEDLRRITQFR